MADERKKGAGGKLARSETVTVRLDPKLRYLAEVAARKQRRTLSSFVEWSVEDSLTRFALKEGEDFTVSVADEAENLWDVDEADRFAKMALRYPELLTHREQLIWKLVRENGYLWRGSYASRTKEWTWTVQEKSLLFDRLRQHWTTFNEVADGEKTLKDLPTWKRVDGPATGFEDMDDELPF